MINVIDYVKLIIKKKKMTRTDFCRRINKVEEKLGDKRTHLENITYWFNEKTTIRPITLLKWEKALDLTEGTLVSMVGLPKTREGLREYKKMRDKLREVYKNER